MVSARVEVSLDNHLLVRSKETVRSELPPGEGRRRGTRRDRGAGSAIRLVGAILADLHDEWQATERRYLSEHSMATLSPERDTIATAELTPGHHHRGSTPKPTTPRDAPASSATSSETASASVPPDRDISTQGLAVQVAATISDRVVELVSHFSAG